MPTSSRSRWFSDRGRTHDSGRGFSLAALVLFALVAARMSISAHAPDVGDALFCLGFAAIIAFALLLDRSLVLPAPFGAVLIIVLALLGSVASSWHPLVSFLSLPSALCALAAFLAVAALGSAGRMPALFGLLLGGALSSAAAVVQRFITWPDALRRKDELGLGAREIAQLTHARPLGLSLSPDLMSALALAGVVAGIALSSSKNGAVKAGAGALALVCAAGLVVSRSAGGALAAGALVAVWAVIVVVRRLRGPLALLMLAGALLVPAVLVVLLGRGVEQLTLSASERLQNWHVGKEVFEEHVFSGVGFARFAAAYLAERPPDANVTRYAHSFFVQTLVEGGLLFGGAVLVIVVGGLLLLLRARLTTPEDRSRDVVLAGVAALLLRAAYDYDLQISATATSFAVLLGVAWVDARRDGPVMAEAVVPATARRRTALASLVLAGFVLVGVSAAVLGVFRDSALAPFARGGAVAAGDVERLRAYAELFPEDPHAATVQARLLTAALLACASECAAVEQQARALLDVERAHPPPDVALLEATLAKRRGELAAMERAFARALESDPGSPQAHRLRLRFARDAGDPRADEYQQEAERWRISAREDL